LSAHNLKQLLGTFELELGFTTRLRAPAEAIETLPASLRPLYALSNGVDLPFGTIFPRAEQDHRCGPEWLCFGQDHYSTYYLCRCEPDPNGLSLAAWDHESRTPIEATHADVEEWLESEYQRYVEGSLNWADLRIDDLPTSGRLGEIVPRLKSLVPATSTAALLSGLRALPFLLEGVRCEDAIGIVRQLGQVGVRATLQNIRPEKVADYD
jgi:hypothetical protein